MWIPCPLTPGEGGLTDGADITVSMSTSQNSAAVANANDVDYSDYFKSRNENYAISYTDAKQIRPEKIRKFNVKFIIEQNGKSLEIQADPNTPITAPTLADVTGGQMMPGYTLEGWCRDRHTLSDVRDFSVV